ncbi:acetyl-CoA acetyltransferase [Kordiimonas sediminis]|uniref:Beta-ketoadipyl-CoA thiolase n=1 Tax=Kordiimonas sediminis TaxID=1735581 RepID=A0A919E436_9PROT|nr:3-oxoadipyl-CoA thiolase [Kordiimonas sediminis]GHF10979.1 acetyl-CoA acetyltransferase [Kordiimonas sediminis]
MADAFICDGIRTPIGRFGGALSSVRADDLAALPIKELMKRNPGLTADAIEDLILGCANQAGEDNRNVARMASLLADLGTPVPGTTVNRLCGSGMDAISMAARAIKADEANLMIAGGVESMSRAPFVMPKASSAFSRNAEIYDTTIGWRFVNKKLKADYGIDSMPETAENVAEEFSISRVDQDIFAAASQEKYQKAKADGFFDEEIMPVEVRVSRKETATITEDEHPRAGTTAESLGKLPTPFRENGTVTAGNASGVNDGACAVIVASADAARKYGLTPKARIVGTAVAGLPPRIMGFGPAPASKLVLERTGIALSDIDVIELNEAFAAQGLAVTRDLGLADDDSRVNPNGGAIAIGHPLGMSGARLVWTAARELERRDGKYALCTMCIGVGQGIAMIIERV